MNRYTSHLFEWHEYNFKGLIQELFDCRNLNYLHSRSTKEYNDLFEVGKDSCTEFHDIFYKKYHAGWPEMQKMYDDFIRDVISWHFDEDILVQKFPTFRVHLPGNLAVGDFHTDAKFHHPAGEINFIVPMTCSEGTASVWIESAPGRKDYQPAIMDNRKFIKFNGNILSHGSKVNDTGKTRVSFDFRVLPVSCYNPSAAGSSITMHKQFLEGEYYTRFLKARAKA